MEVEGLSKAAAAAEAAKFQEPRAQCDLCKKEILKRELTDHKKRVHGIGKVAKVPVQGSSNLDASRDSLTSMAGDLGINQAPEPELKTDDQFIVEFDEFMKSSRGRNMADKSREGYRNRIKDFLKFWGEKNPNFSAGRISNFGSKSNFLNLPTPEEWFETMDSAPARQSAINAFIKLVDFLIDKNQQSENYGLMDEETVAKRHSRLTMLRDRGSKALKINEPQVLKERRENELTREDLAESDKDRRIPQEELEKLLENYSNSKGRKDLYALVSDADKLAESLKRKQVYPVKIRNFVAFETLLESQGLRPDAIYNIKFSELYNAKEVEIDLDGTKVTKRCIRTKEHKTAKSHGAAKVLIQVETYQCLLNYAKVVRPFLYKDAKEGGDEYIFINYLKGTKFDRLHEICDFIKADDESNFNIKCYDFRRLYATLAQDDDDQKVRENAPRHMGHSQAIVHSNYRDHIAQVKEFASIQTRLKRKVGGGGAGAVELPAVSVDKDELERNKEKVNSVQRERIEQEKKERERKRKANVPQVPGKYNLTDDDKDLIRKTFEFAKDSEGKPRKTITLLKGERKGEQSHFYQAYDTVPEFRKLVDHMHLERKMTHADIRKKIGDAYHAMHRGDRSGTKPSSSSMGSAPKPSTSKAAKKTSQRVSKRRRRDESESEEEEEEDVSDHSGNSSDF